MRSSKQGASLAFLLCAMLLDFVHATEVAGWSAAPEIHIFPEKHLRLEYSRKKAQDLRATRLQEKCALSIRRKLHSACHVTLELVASNPWLKRTPHSHTTQMENDARSISLSQNDAHWLYRVCQSSDLQWNMKRKRVLLSHAHTFGEYLAEEGEQRRRWITRAGKFVWDNYERFSLGSPEMDPRDHRATTGEWSRYPMFVYDNIDSLWMFNLRSSAINIVRWIEVATVIHELRQRNGGYLHFRKTYIEKLSELLSSLSASFGVREPMKSELQCHTLEPSVLRLVDTYAEARHSLADDIIDGLATWLDSCVPPFNLSYATNTWRDINTSDTSSLSSTKTLLRILKDPKTAYPTFDHDQQTVSFFEMTIRALGGLLSGFTFTGHPVILYRAWDLGHKLSHGLHWCMTETPSCLYEVVANEVCVPNRYVDLAGWNAQPILPPNFTTSAAVIGSNQLEFRTLSEFTGVCEYTRTSDRMLHAILINSGVNQTGLMPIYMMAYHDTKMRHIHVDYRLHFGIGAEIDSFYEYLVKASEQLWGKDAVRNQAIVNFASVFSTFLASSPTNNSKPVEQLPSSVAIPADHDHWIDNGNLRMTKFLSLRKFSLTSTQSSTILSASTDHTHLGCFVGGLLVMMSDLADVSVHLKRKLRLNAEHIAESCAILYLTGPLGLAPENMVLESSDPHSGRGSYLRPEVIETLTYLWHSTHKIKYRNLGWQYFTAMMANGRDKYGLCSVKDSGAMWPSHSDCRQDTWILAETLKYMLMLFSSKSLLTHYSMRPAFPLGAVKQAGRYAAAQLFKFFNIDRHQSTCPLSTRANLSDYLCPINQDSTLKFYQFEAVNGTVIKDAYDVPFVPRLEAVLLDSHAYKESLGEGSQLRSLSPGLILTTEAHPVPIVDEILC